MIIAILPANIVSPASRAAKIWCVVRSIDHPDNGGTGCGLVKISMKDLCYYLRRSERSVWRYIKEAQPKDEVKNPKGKGYFYRCEFSGGIFTIEYRGLKSLTRHLGLESIGPIGEVPLVKIQHAATFACDLVAEQLQGQSFFQMKKEAGKAASGQKSASELLSEDAPSVRVPGGDIIARGKRLLYLSADWLVFGGSQKTIADRLGCSVRTVQNRLSNVWRGERGIPFISKAQSAKEVIEGCPGAFLDKLISFEEDANRFVRLGRRLFKVGCNLYESPVESRSQRFRKKEFWAYYNGSEESTKIRRAPKTLHHTTGGGASNLSSEVFEFSENSELEPQPNFRESARL